MSKESSAEELPLSEEDQLNAIIFFESFVEVHPKQPELLFSLGRFYKEAYGVEEFDDVQRRRPNLNKLKAMTGFSPKYSLPETIEEILRSLQIAK